MRTDFTRSGGRSYRRALVRGAFAIASFILVCGLATVPTYEAGATNQASQFSGTLEDAQGNPVQCSSLVITEGSFESSGSHCGPDGSFSVTVPSGVAQFSMGLNDQQDAHIFGSIDLTNSVTGLQLQAPSPVPVSVVVTDPSGNPVSGASVILSLPSYGDALPDFDPSAQVQSAALETSTSAIQATTDATGTAVENIFTYAGQNGLTVPTTVEPPSGSQLAGTEVDESLPTSFGAITLPITLPQALTVLRNTSRTRKATQCNAVRSLSPKDRLRARAHIVDPMGHSQ